MWTFGRRIALGFALSSALLILIGAVAYRGLGSLTRTSYSVAHSHLVLDHLNRLLSAMQDAETGQRGFVITGDEAYLQPYTDGTREVHSLVAATRDLVGDNASHRAHLDETEALIERKLNELKRIIEIRRTDGLAMAAKAVETGEGKRAMDELRGALGQMEREERDALKQRAADVEGSAAVSKATLIYGTLVCLLFVSVAGTWITRSLAGQIGAAVQHVQSSTTELQAAANQQVVGAKEQATAMTEIATTISELLTTSRQIAESARRVADVAADTASSARTGDETVRRTQESVGAIRKQVDVIVAYMGELGRKSQQIGGVLEIINELAEQTNILAINATIEASGAGEAGKRFGVVADEIRKLADRVGGSTKEIRALVDDIRSSVNATVMATEGGSKAVDAGTRQFDEVTTAFRQIAGLVATTTEAAREIELSTKQQATAVEQVNVAMASVSQAAKETEASSTQTLQTSSQLTNLSRELARVIRPQPGA
jgi:methyl-accepting chemotaxis protein